MTLVHALVLNSCCCCCFGFPSSGGDLDWEVGRGEEGQDLGGDVVAALVNALAE